ncbi:MAG: hypothetical protein KGH93_00060 [Patescibacteria group bacterium]|nr:hypothetical protein [Patescibacteria group bacterium]MDE1945592.1 hypothetical protein [Patescibacteria group bacterium]
MSNQKFATALLKGWDGPFFPDNLAKLQCLYDSKTGITEGYLEKVGEQDFRGLITAIPDLKTEDAEYAYPWFRGLEIAEKDRKILILFPYCHDYEKSDGTRTNWHIAVHTQGNVNQELLQSTIERIICGFENLKTEEQLALNLLYRRDPHFGNGPLSADW